MDLVFCMLKKAQKHEFNFLQDLKSSESMNSFFVKLINAQNT